MKLSNYIVTLIVIAGAIATVVYVQTTATLPATESSVDGMLANVGLPDQDLHFVGSQTCGTCHANQYQQWQESDHFKAMQLPTTSSVLGDFSDVTVKFHQIESRFYQLDDIRMIQLLHNFNFFS